MVMAADRILFGKISEIRTHVTGANDVPYKPIAANKNHDTWLDFVPMQIQYFHRYRQCERDLRTALKYLRCRQLKHYQLQRSRRAPQTPYREAVAPRTAKGATQILKRKNSKLGRT